MIQSPYREPSEEEVVNNLVPLEIMGDKGWQSGAYPDLLYFNRELDQFGDDLEQRWAHAIIRTSE